MPIFHSQTAIAYNPDIVKDVPDSYAELVEGVKKNPKQFGYNGIKGGMSGVAFVTGWIYAFGGAPAKLMQSPYDATAKAAWDKAPADLPLLLYNASMGGNYQIASITALILLVPSVAFTLVIERFLKADVMAKVGR
jgi:ABC-type uncharacterized transport system YnjBCD substrate-binding protein